MKLLLTCVTLTCCVLIIAPGKPAPRQSHSELQKSASSIYEIEMAKEGHDCENVKGQQPLNVCLGEASEQLEQHYKTFYSNLRQLIGSESAGQLAEAETNWEKYRSQICDLAAARYAGGTYAPAASSLCFLQVTRAHMKALDAVFNLRQLL